MYKERQEKLFYLLLSLSILICAFTFVLSVIDCFTMASCVLSLLLLILDISAIFIRLWKLKVKVYWLGGMEINGENISFCGYKEEFLKNSSIESDTVESDSFHYSRNNNSYWGAKSHKISDEANRSTSETGGASDYQNAKRRGRR